MRAFGILFFGLACVILAAAVALDRSQGPQRAQIELAKIEVERVREQNLAELRLLRQQQAAEDAATVRSLAQAAGLLVVIAIAVFAILRAVLFFIDAYIRHVERLLLLRMQAAGLLPSGAVIDLQTTRAVAVSAHSREVQPIEARRQQ